MEIKMLQKIYKQAQKNFQFMIEDSLQHVLYAVIWIIAIDKMMKNIVVSQ